LRGKFTGLDVFDWAAWLAGIARWTHTDDRLGESFLRAVLWEPLAACSLWANTQRKHPDHLLG
jgi:hypothetical protein